MARKRKYRYRADLHARLIEVAATGRTIAYSALPGGRGHIGSYLYRIAHEEQAACRPPLTAVVVHKNGGEPGPGFLEAAKWVGYWRPGETQNEVWQRALTQVHEYWRPKLTDDLAGGPDSDATDGSAAPQGQRKTNRRSKYVPLQDHLARLVPPVHMKFAQIDRLVGGLPRSARAHREWWANHAGNPQARAWLDAGRRVEAVDLPRGIVTFT